jgi:hypothetical protein
MFLVFSIIKTAFLSSKKDGLIIQQRMLLSLKDIKKG